MACCGCEAKLPVETYHDTDADGNDVVKTRKVGPDGTLWGSPVIGSDGPTFSMTRGAESAETLSITAAYNSIGGTCRDYGSGCAQDNSCGFLITFTLALVGEGPVQYADDGTRSGFDPDFGPTLTFTTPPGCTAAGGAQFVMTKSNGTPIYFPAVEGDEENPGRDAYYEYFMDYTAEITCEPGCGGDTEVSISYAYFLNDPAEGWARVNDATKWPIVISFGCEACKSKSVTGADPTTGKNRDDRRNDPTATPPFQA